MTIHPVRNTLRLVAALCLSSLPLAAADVSLVAVQYPERSSVEVRLMPTQRVSPAEAEADVKFKEGQARVEIEYKNLPPAILFGGDVTSYVVWAVTRDGAAENLGELIVREPNGSSDFRTGQKEFALLITAEPYPMVLRPSELVAFASTTPKSRKVQSTPVTLSNLVVGVRLESSRIGGLRYSGPDPLDLVEAQAVLAQAQRMRADQYAPDAVRDAGIALAQATSFFHAGKIKQGVDYARRSLALSSAAIRDTDRHLAEEATAAAEAKRAAEMQGAEERRAAAEQQAAASHQQALTAHEQELAAREQALAAREEAAAAQRQLTDAQQQASAAQQQLASLQQQADQAQREAAEAQRRAEEAGSSAQESEAARREAEAARRRAEDLAAAAQDARGQAERAQAEAKDAAERLEQQKQQLQQENERLVREREDLAGRLTVAISEVAQITKTARGVVVNLPDILFDTNKATLKPNAQIALAKLAGIVSLFPAINLRVEGHTDSTGTDVINNRLSRERANSVARFLRQQGVAESRMTADGYGSKLPIADNATAEGRSRNRRVEIILAEGVIQAP